LQVVIISIPLKAIPHSCLLAAMSPRISTVELEDQGMSLKTSFEYTLSLFAVSKDVTAK